jgi:hypothetical protein
MVRSGWLWTAVYTTLCVLAVACGGAQKGGGDHYQASVDKQRACCGQLGDPTERAACVDRIVTVDDLVDADDSEAVKSSTVNQATFRCMSDYFVCDPSSGQATAESRQAQLDCVNDISGQ